MSLIISCSRRTDIPAFYGPWFANRLAAGFAEYRTSYDPAPRRVSLLREDVTGFVFWTKNPVPFEPILKRLAVDGWPWVLHMTITSYPRAIEPRIPDAEAAVAAFQRLARIAGPDAMIWRYDPIVVTGKMDVAWHRANFRRLADRLAGSTREVFVSIVAPYRRTRMHLSGFDVDWDPGESQKADLVGGIVEVARERGMAVNACCCPDLVLYGAVAGRCIGPGLLSRAWGIDLSGLHPRPTRKHCGCVESVDIGVTDSCRGGCLYCYSNRSPQYAQANADTRHDPSASILLRPFGGKA